MMNREIAKKILLNAKKQGLTVVGIINMENGCCKDKPVVVQRMGGDHPLYACECACGGWCTGSCAHIDEAVNRYRRMVMGEPIYGPYWFLDEGKGYFLRCADETFRPCPICGKREQGVWWNRDWGEDYPPTTLQYSVGCDCGLRLDGTVRVKLDGDGECSVEQAFEAARSAWNRRRRK